MKRFSFIAAVLLCFVTVASAAIRPAQPGIGGGTSSGGSSTNEAKYMYGTRGGGAITLSAKWSNAAQTTAIVSNFVAAAAGGYYTNRAAGYYNIAIGGDLRATNNDTFVLALEVNGATNGTLTGYSDYRGASAGVGNSTNRVHVEGIVYLAANTAIRPLWSWLSSTANSVGITDPFIMASAVDTSTGGAGSTITTNGNQFSGVPLSIKDAARLTNTITTGVAEFTGRVTNSATSGGGFWSPDSSGFVSLSSPTDFILMSQPQGGIFGTLDGWVLGQGNSGATILSLSTNLSQFPNNLRIAGDNSVGGDLFAMGTYLDSVLITNIFYIPNGAAPTPDGFGSLVADNNLWAASRGAILTYDGTANVALVGTLTSDTPSNGQVPTWNTGGTITWETPAAGSGSTQMVAAAIGTLTVTNNIEQLGDGATPGSHILYGTNNIGVVFKAANSNSVSITNVVGLLHKASAAVIVLDCNHGNRFQVTNRLGQGTTFVVTNLAQGQEITIKGSADGTSQSVTVVPQLGYLVRDFDVFGVAAALNKAITATNGNTFEINIAAAWEHGTNWADVVTRQATY